MSETSPNAPHSFEDQVLEDGLDAIAPDGDTWMKGHAAYEASVTEGKTFEQARWDALDAIAPDGDTWMIGLQAMDRVLRQRIEEKKHAPEEGSEEVSTPAPQAPEMDRNSVGTLDTWDTLTDGSAEERSEALERHFGFLRDRPIGIYHWRPSNKSLIGEHGFQTMAVNSRLDIERGVQSERAIDGIGVVMNTGRRQPLALMGVEVDQDNDALDRYHRKHGVAEVVSVRPLSLPEVEEIPQAPEEQKRKRWGRSRSVRHDAEATRTRWRPGTMGDVLGTDDSTPAVQLVYTPLMRIGIADKVSNGRQGAVENVGVIVSQEEADLLLHNMKEDPRWARDFFYFITNDLLHNESPLSLGRLGAVGATHMRFTGEDPNVISPENELVPIKGYVYKEL